MPFTRRTALLGAWLVAYVLSMAHCTWEPLARPVQPQLVMLGSMRIAGQLEWEARRVLVEEKVADSSRWHLVETDSLTFCTLPEGRPLNILLLSPKLRGVTNAKLLLPLRRARPDSDVEDLYLFDEKCGLHGPYGEINGDDPRAIQLRADQRQVLLVRDGKNALRLLDPWTNTTTHIAENVAEYAVVESDNSGRLPEALWLIEDGKLTQRGYDGTLLVSMGQNVSVFIQKFAGAEKVLRVAYVEGENGGDGGELFEAVSPNYLPVRIATTACGPEYVGDALDVRTPCNESQLVRIEAGQVRYFERGVERILTVGDFRFEQLKTPEGESQVWLARKDGPRFQVIPAPTNGASLTALDSDRYAGRANSDQIGVWNLRSGAFTPVLSKVRDTWFFSSQRRWLALHDVDDSGTGKLSSFTESSMFRALQTQSEVALDTLAEGVASGGYRPYPAPGVSEPIVIGCANARVQDKQPRIRGTLVARLLSNSMGSFVDENVSSFTLVVAPQPGVLYAITEGPRSGLWFAAL